MEPQGNTQDKTPESQATPTGDGAHSTDSTMPMSMEEAESVWEGLATLAQRNLARLGLTQGCWFVGQHGGELVALVLRQDGRIEPVVYNGEPELLLRLPKFPYAAGRHSLIESIRSKSPASAGGSLVWHQTPGELAEVLHSFFLYHATKPLPSDQPIEVYDPSKKSMRTVSAQSIIEGALKAATKLAKPSDESAFRDCWACEALAYVLNETTDLQVLTKAGAEKLDILRAYNVHRTRHDLVTQARMLNLMMELREEMARKQAVVHPELPYHVAQRACMAALRRAYALGLSDQTKHPDTFSQRLIKGLLIASACEARLKIGSLFQAVAPPLVPRYGMAWSSMQEVEIVALGRPTSELRVRQDVDCAAGVFRLLDERGTVMDPPRVLLRAQEVLLCPGTIFHEWEHVRQHMASEVSINDFQPEELLSDEVTECKALQAEAKFLSDFGIIY